VPRRAFRGLREGFSLILTLTHARETMSTGVTGACARLDIVIHVDRLRVPGDTVAVRCHARMP
jgi:hypothetical protein